MRAVPFVAGQIAMRPLASLVPYARNARTHSEEQLAQLCAAIREFGFTNPVLVDGRDGTIVAGHARTLAAAMVGLAEVPTIDLRHLSAEQRRAYVLADNKLALNAGWDLELLEAEMRELQGTDFDLLLTGFDAGELASLLAPPATEADDADPEETPEPPANPVSRPGDLWLLGAHRLLCGDSTDAAAVTRLLAGIAPHLMVTDPPYGVEYDPNWRNEVDRSNGKPIGARAVGTVANDGTADWRAAWALFRGDVAYVWHAGRYASTVQASLEAAEFEMRCQIIWAKARHIISRGHYHWQHEPCWYAVRKGKTGHWSGDRKQTTLWEIEHRKSDTGHGTQKPVECMRRPIENNSRQGDAVYEPFCGSGTTIIAAQMTRRRCCAIELDPAYIDVAVQRWQGFTGETAVLEDDGRSFADVREERLSGSVNPPAPVDLLGPNREPELAAAG